VRPVTGSRACAGRNESEGPRRVGYKKHDRGLRRPHRLHRHRHVVGFYLLARRDSGGNNTRDKNADVFSMLLIAYAVFDLPNLDSDS